MLKADCLTVRFGAFTATKDVSFTLEEGQWLMLAGPNGAGKSTLLRAIAQEIPYEGTLQLESQDIRSYKPAQLARRIGVLSQQHHVDYAYTVEEIVNLGRYAHQRSFWGTWDDEGQERMEEALRLTSMAALRKKSVLTLSGGELQRVFLAQALAQNPSILLLDEPANHLDLLYQKQLFELIDAWRRRPGRAVISVVHDLSLARRYGTHALLMHHGQAVAQGSSSSVFTSENLNAVYDMDVQSWMRGLMEVWE